MTARSSAPNLTQWVPATHPFLLSPPPPRPARPAAAGRGRGGGLLGDPHPHADDVVAGVREQRRGQRAVDPAAHGDECAPAHGTFGPIRQRTPPPVLGRGGRPPPPPPPPPRARPPR